MSKEELAHEAALYKQKADACRAAMVKSGDKKGWFRQAADMFDDLSENPERGRWLSRVLSTAISDFDSGLHTPQNEEQTDDTTDDSAD